MKLATKINISAITSLGVFLSSMFFNIIPCQTAPNVPNPTYVWKLCSFNPNLVSSSVKNLFFGYTGDLRQAYFLSLIGVFLAVFLITSLLTREKHKKQ
jgi:hypothetical protein